MTYPYLKAWGEMLSSNKSYVYEQVRQAEYDKAPNDAIFWSGEYNRWVTYGEVTSTSTRLTIDRLVKKYLARGTHD